MTRTKLHNSGREMDYSVLDERFTPYYESGEQVEVAYADGHEIAMGHTGCRTGGKRVRFYVGRSTGWKPIYLMILTTRSLGGMQIFSSGIESIRGTGKYRR